MYSFKQMLKGLKALSKLGVSAKQMRINLNKFKKEQTPPTTSISEDLGLMGKLVQMNHAQQALVRRLHEQQNTITNQNKIIDVLKKEIESFRNARNF